MAQDQRHPGALPHRGVVTAAVRAQPGDLARKASNPFKSAFFSVHVFVVSAQKGGGWTN